MFERLAAAVKSQVTRAKVVRAAIGGRTFLQITGMDGEIQNTVELLLPPGYSANPVVGSDVLKMQVMGTADHVVCLGGDNWGNAIQDLGPGEFGLSDGQQMVIFRQTSGQMLELISPTKVRVQSPILQCTGEITANCDSADSVTLGTHTHLAAGVAGHTAAPDAGT